MVARIAHRGPDGEGFEVRGRVALGHRRLSIIDVEAGHQPMFNEDRQVSVVFNGELYNQLELRQRLEAFGHTFSTRCDTEVLVHGWEQWGTSLVDELRGMFAFAIVDWRQGVVFLARDHFGIKPLYYSLDGERLAFASEIQALQWLPGLPGDMRLDALDRYLSLGYVTAPWTIFERILKLPPASRLVVRFDGQAEAPQTYWRLRFEPEASRSLDDWAEELEHVLRESVRAHLMSDVPFGAFLSGGLDSTAIVSLMAEELDRPVTTFSIGFDDDRRSELPFAAQVAARLGTEHHAEVLRPDAAEVMPDLVRHYGEPFGDNSALPTYYVSRLARRHVPMVLSGDGGDEAFGGYTKYRNWLRATDTVPYRPTWKQWLRPVLTRLLPRRFPADPATRPPTADDLLRLNVHLDAGGRRSLWRGAYHADLDFDANPFDQPFRESEGCEPLGRAQYADYSRYLPDDILVKTDVASMMHGLEVRTPFVDLRVVEFAARIPSRVHVARDRRGRWQTKRVLKKYLESGYPRDFVHRRKRGFSLPLASWFGDAGGLQRALTESLTGQSSRVAEYFRREALRELLAEHLRDGSHARALWSLFFLETWLQLEARPALAEVVT